jgi:acylphosphatase
MDLRSKFWGLQHLLKVLYMITRRLRITGRVQGVGYRYALRYEAEKRGVTGWVRNRLDGSVEAVIQGAPERVEELIAWARRGPPASRVADLSIDLPGEDERPYAGFELRPTS